MLLRNKSILWNNGGMQVIKSGDNPIKEFRAKITNSNFDGALHQQIVSFS
jgi:hypothetical protein